MSTPTHIVVLMLENCSFDHMLGFLPKAGELGKGQGNPFDPSQPGRVVPATPDAHFSLVIDSCHSAYNVHEQLWGQLASTDSDEAPDEPGTPPMNGFISNYRSELKLNGLPGDGSEIMKCFSPEGLPILSKLAQEYCVCTRWFSSMPGPTWPNRFYVHAATSHGHVSGGFDERLEGEVPTIYDQLDAAGVPWCIYSGDFAQAWGIQRLLDRLIVQLGHVVKPQPRYNFASLAQFFTDVERGTLPNYVFLEPHYVTTDLWPATDQHPPHDVRFGEDLIRRVYNALTQSTYWEQTLFVIMYDEHGGTFDHVPPPSTVNPDGVNEQRKDSKPPFDFQRLGVRIPAVLVSPYIGQGTVDSTVYDHSSVLATANKIFGLGPARLLTQRDRQANTFENLLSLPAPRPRPAPIPPVPIDASALPSSTGYSDYQLEILGNAAHALKARLGLSLQWGGKRP